ncbi:MAG: hypothetical protein Q4P78_06040 [Rothia sp. (in: high G+C Gram-positive bacteria)]|uniref:hypothetical protein n=1 Tax=Rothia sp. (in: high G+C Gram-positive bacteria) TaxID=1885016 RepID=UPI0026E011E9|nr:hypothetical protein [Rothia sp. (in: high G+C Gram-positive bacteria)]MDO5750749.1 hypothetical protein [Rothia sp. (in: high G+C Gram-positive bacteria)]
MLRDLAPAMPGVPSASTSGAFDLTAPTPELPSFNQPLRVEHAGGTIVPVPVSARGADALLVQLSLRHSSQTLGNQFARSTEELPASDGLSVPANTSVRIVVQQCSGSILYSEATGAKLPVLQLSDESVCTIQSRAERVAELDGFAGEELFNGTGYPAWQWRMVTSRDLGSDRALAQLRFALRSSLGVKDPSASYTVTFESTWGTVVHSVQL